MNALSGPSMNDMRVPFDTVTQNLQAAGAVTVREFTTSSWSPESCQPHSCDRSALSAVMHLENADFAAPDIPPELTNTTMRSVARLHQLCQNVYGNIDALYFWFDEQGGANNKQCILTITRPNGSTRTYTTESVFARKNEAKERAATIAIEAGAIEFIMTGESQLFTESPKPYVSPEGEALCSAHSTVDMDESMRQIEQCCMEWRAGLVRPYWLVINEPKFGRTQGCALRIQLSVHSSQVYSVDTTYNSPAEAKKACAQAALAEGVLDYIRYGNGQTEPATKTDNSLEPLDSMSTDLRPWTVQGFLESLPQPMPAPFQFKAATEINAPAWLNGAIQSARGGKIAANFIWTIEPKLGLHGCLLRLERPGECKSYLVDARFAKRAEAKGAVCLQAMSQGVGDYINRVAQSVEAKLSVRIRKHVTDVLLPILFFDYRKLRPGAIPDFQYQIDKDACGCTLTVALSATPTPEQTRTYSVPAEYRNRNDAKTAVVALAVEQGVIEFIRFRGAAPPPTYVPAYVQPPEPNQYVDRKRKADWGGQGGFSPQENWDRQQKRPKFNGVGQGNYGGYAVNHLGGSGFQQQPWSNNGSNGNSHQNGSWSNRVVPGPGQAGGVRGPAPAGYSTGQFQPEPRNYFPPYHDSMNASPPQNGTYRYGPVGPMNGGDQAAYHNQVAPHPPPFQAPPANPYYSTTSSSTFYGAPMTYSSYTSAPAAGPPAVTQQQYGVNSAPFAPYYAAPPMPPYQQYSQTYYSAPAISQTTVPTYTMNPSQPPSVPPYPAYSTTGPPTVPPAPSSISVNPSWPANVNQGNTPAVPVAPTAQPVPKVEQASPPPIPAAATADKKTIAKRTRSSKLVSRAAAGSGKVTIVVESPPKSSVTALYDHCVKASLPTPQFCHEIVMDPQGDNKHKVWVVLGKRKLELPVTFSSLSQGQERVAKKVLDQLRAQASAEKK